MVLSLVLFLVFVLWVGRQERLGKPTIVQNSLWLNYIFTSICPGQFFNLGFDQFRILTEPVLPNVQGNSPSRTALHFLRGVISASLCTLIVGFIAQMFT